MEQLLSGILQALIIGFFCFVGVYLWYRVKTMKEHPGMPKTTAPLSAIKQPALNIANGFDVGLIAGSYSILFFMAAIFDALFNVIHFNKNDMIGLLVILDLFTVAAWIWGTSYKTMRGIATLFAVATTGLVALILVRHAMHGGS